MGGLGTPQRSRRNGRKSPGSRGAKRNEGPRAGGPRSCARSKVGRAAPPLRGTLSRHRVVDDDHAALRLVILLVAVVLALRGRLRQRQLDARPLALVIPLALLDLFDDEGVEHWENHRVTYRIDAILAPSFHDPASSAARPSAS